jgi:CRP-like cAMP-binding protein
MNTTPLPDITGRADIEVLVNAFYDKVRKDDLIGFVFEKIARTDWAAHLPKMYSFWETMIFRTGGYVGNPIAAHARFLPFANMDRPQFERWLSLFKATVDERFSGPKAGHIKNSASDMVNVIHGRLHNVPNPRFDPANLTPEQRAVFRAGQSFAEAALASPGGYPADARALEPTRVLLVPKADILALLRQRPKLALRMLGSMSQHLRVLVGLLDDLTLKNVETRLANWLLKRCPHPLRTQRVTFELDRTKRVLAAELGTVSETLSRTFADFRSKKLITVSGKTIAIHNPQTLNQLLQRNLAEA